MFMLFSSRKYRLMKAINYFFPQVRNIDFNDIIMMNFTKRRVYWKNKKKSQDMTFKLQ